MSHPDLTRLVHKLARRYSWCGADMDDLVAEGFLGLAIATDRFDPERGVKFITYAHHWIRGKVQKAADKHIKVDTAPGLSMLRTAMVKPSMSESEARL